MASDGTDDARPEGTGAELTEEVVEEYGKLLRFTLSGYLGGLALAAVLDAGGHSRSALGQWAVRTLSGEGESLFEGIFALRQRLRRSAASMAEAYGWGKFLGMTAPWIIDGASRAGGVEVHGVEGFYIPFFYAMADQIGASAAGFVFLRRRSESLLEAFRSYLGHPVMLSGIVVILLVPGALLAARILGFSPSSQLRAAIETIAANLCWVPPLVGWLSERKRARRSG